MNKTHLVTDVARRAGMTAELARQAVEALFGGTTAPGIIVEALERGERVQLAGFGTFESRLRAERVARNPQTKQPIVIPAGMAAAFRPGTALRARLRTALPCEPPAGGGKVNGESQRLMRRKDDT